MIEQTEASPSSAYDISALKYVDEVTQYLKNKSELAQIEAIEKSSHGISVVLSSVLIGMLGVLIFVFLNVSIGLGIGELVSNYTLGFLMLSFFYVVLSAAVFFIEKNVVEKTILTQLISKVYKS